MYMAKIDVIKSKLDDHIKQQDLDMIDIKSGIKDIKENHLAHLTKDMYKLKSRVNGVYLVAGVLAPILIFLMNKYL